MFGAGSGESDNGSLSLLCSRGGRNCEVKSKEQQEQQQEPGRPKRQLAGAVSTLQCVCILAVPCLLAIAAAVCTGLFVTGCHFFVTLHSSQPDYQPHRYYDSSSSSSNETKNVFATPLSAIPTSLPSVSYMGLWTVQQEFFHPSDNNHNDDYGYNYNNGNNNGAVSSHAGASAAVCVRWKLAAQTQRTTTSSSSALEYDNGGVALELDPSFKFARTTSMCAMLLSLVILILLSVWVAFTLYESIQKKRQAQKLQKEQPQHFQRRQLVILWLLRLLTVACWTNGALSALSLTALSSKIYCRRRHRDDSDVTNNHTSPNYACKIARDGKFCIAAFVLWMATSAVLLVLLARHRKRQVKSTRRELTLQDIVKDLEEEERKRPHPTVILEDSNETAESCNNDDTCHGGCIRSSVTTVQNDDGTLTRVTTTTEIHPDGSRTVTKTVATELLESTVWNNKSDDNDDTDSGLKDSSTSLSLPGIV